MLIIQESESVMADILRVHTHTHPHCVLPFNETVEMIFIKH